MAKNGQYSREGFTAVVLAGQRRGDSPLAGRFNLPLKALIPVAGKPMIQRVVESLYSSQWVGPIFISCPEIAPFVKVGTVGPLLDSGQIRWIQSERSPSSSASKALRRGVEDSPVLLTTADHALLTTEMVDFFCNEAHGSGADLVVGLVRLELVQKAYPRARRTYYSFSDGRYCSCNLFGFMTYRAYGAVDYWQRVEEKRKHPLQVVGSFGWLWVLRYLVGTVSLEMAFRRASDILGCNIRAVLMPFPEAAIDVDTMSDWQMAEKIASDY